MATASARKKTLVPLTIAAVAALVALVMALTSVLGDGESSADDPGAGAPVTSGGQPAAGSENNSLAAVVRRQPGDPLAKGEVDSPVVMVSYSDFQCPFCGKFARDTEPKLVSKYVDTGVLRIEWRDFPYLGAESTTAARAGRAAAAQQKFWEFHDKLYGSQSAPNTGTLTQEYLVGVAGGLGLDIDKFRTDMDAPETAQVINEDFTMGQQIGVSGTPAFLVNGRPIIGAQPIQVFEQAIEQAATEAQAGK